MSPAERRVHLAGMESHLRSRLLGQDHLLGRAAAMFQRGEMGLATSGRPRGSCLLIGPTGTGKTELVLLSGDYLFGPENRCRFDLSEYARPDAVARFLGVDRKDPGDLGRALRGRKCGILHFDELEKSHPTLWDIFLQLLDPGHVTLATGERVSVAPFYLSFTSNLGGAEAMRMEQSTFASVERTVLRRLTQTLRPELVERIEEKWVFARLTPEVQREVCALRVADELGRLRALGHDVQISRAALEFLVREGFDPHVGARRLRNTVERHLRDAVVRGLLAHGAACGEIEPDGPAPRLKIHVR
ncbi:MAG: ATP-dependent Clp protease ATP-binding subunit [Opitutaceae bacterium]|nr:ATP-dependent Clp protease ATP-binding subunit [Opitutaceae bacterium]